MASGRAEGTRAAGQFVGIEVEGIAELRRKLAERPVYADPVARALLKAALLVEGESKRLAPVDTGRLRASITHRLEPTPSPRWAEVGTNVAYARFVHDGRKPGGRMPPPVALATWARRHGGQSAFVLARAIGRRGTKARPFLQGALDKLRERIVGLVQEAARETEEAWRR